MTKHKLLIISIVISIIILIVICIILVSVNKKEQNNEKFDSEKIDDYFDCYLSLTDINPMFVKAYKKFDNKHISNGYCKNATLHVSVDTCPIDNSGNPSSYCKQSATLTSSKGNPQEFTLEITPNNVSKFFGIT